MFTASRVSCLGPSLLRDLLRCLVPVECHKEGEEVEVEMEMEMVVEEEEEGKVVEEE